MGFLLTAKPTLFACNVGEEDLAHPENNPWVQKVKEYAATHLEAGSNEYVATRDRHAA